MVRGIIHGRQERCHHFLKNVSPTIIPLRSAENVTKARISKNEKLADHGKKSKTLVMVPKVCYNTHDDLKHRPVRNGRIELELRQQDTRTASAGDFFYRRTGQPGRRSAVDCRVAYAPVEGALRAICGFNRHCDSVMYAVHHVRLWD